MTQTSEPVKPAKTSVKHDSNQQNQVNPKTQFIGATLNMSWQLAIVVLVPVVGGFEIDKHTGSAPLWTIVGFILAMIGATVIIKRSLDQFSVNVKQGGSK